MPGSPVTRNFEKVWNRFGGSAPDIAAHLGIGERAVFKKRDVFERTFGIPLKTISGTERGRGSVPANSYLQRVTIDGFGGTAIVFSDAHYHPGIGSTVAHKALIEIAKEYKPKLIVANGDIFDGARLSRFPRNGWEEQPRVADELDEVRDRMAEIRHACRGARLTRTVGNHCIRFDRYLAMNAGEMEGVMGSRLADHLPEWEECISVFVNQGTMIKHRFKGGIHAAFNNVRDAGTNFVSGHTHYLEVKPWADYRGRRYGVQTGSLADPNSPAFAYTEDNPTPWCSGFAVLTFTPDGRLLHPDLCEVVDGTAWFRGQRVVSERKKARAA